MLLVFWDIKENTQTKKKIADKLGTIEKQLKKALDNKLSNYQVKTIFTDSNRIKQLNKTYRELNKETDVLSFAELDINKKLLKEEKSLGEIYINYDWIVLGKSPLERGTPRSGGGCVNLKEKTDIASILFLHGYLHLLGHDHEKDQGEMERLEKKLRIMLLK